ncbi:MAG: 50S ribosomal protein L17 [Ignavibacteria bacterium GWA2_55_25]|nr:MAG: 50S ribosomal protein L17 [Ignavibacteria bacterium GWA2_55_25]
MRHQNSGRKLGRTASHRKATLSALSVSLIQHKRIRTTTAKAKEARMVVEKLITRAKRAVVRETDGKQKDVHARREVFAFLRDRTAVSTLFNDIAPKVATRPGGYTRVVKLGRRLGDGAEIAILELVDYNTGQEKAAAKATTTKKKPGKKPKAESAAVVPAKTGKPAVAQAETEVPAVEGTDTEAKAESPKTTKA